MGYVGNTSSCAGEILRSLQRSIDDLVNRMIELAQEARLCRFTPLTIPSAVFLDLGGRIISYCKPTDEEQACAKVEVASWAYRQLCRIYKS